ncbi:MAG TPA: hypothetical protein VFQ25_06475 [Ktedonobacterales bacterium]|nr:hypothetical protein [Ktedonobacterales bacterium]
MVNEPNPTIIASPAAPMDGGALSGARVLSGADVALFALMAGQLDLSGEAQLSFEASPRQPIPQALLTGLLTAAAVRLAGQPDHARVASVTLRFSEQAYTDEPLRISGAAGDADPAGAMRVAVSLHSEDDRLLASGEILIHTS